MARQTIWTRVDWDTATPLPVSRLSDLHAEHVGRLQALWATGPSSDDPERTAFLPMLVAVCRDRKKRTLERVQVAATPETRVSAAAALGRSMARDGLRPVAVSAVSEAWMAPDTGDDRAPSDRPDRCEVVAVATALADGRSLTTVRAVVRSVGGEAALGEVLVDAEPGVEAALPTATFESFRSHNNGYGGG